MKLNAIEYKGGYCERCGWQGHPAAYDFHHKNPEEKEFQWSTQLYKKSWGTIKTELDKCELLCAICHRIEHAQDLDAYSMSGLRQLQIKV